MSDAPSASLQFGEVVVDLHPAIFGVEARLSATTSVMGLVLGTPVAAQKCRRKCKGLEMVSVSKMLTTTLALACFS